MPAAHTDLVLAAIGEELGFAGVARGARALRAAHLARLRIARAAPDDYTMFLALGLALSLAFRCS